MKNGILDEQPSKSGSLAALIKSTASQVDQMIIVTNNPDTDLDGLKIIYVNEAFTRISGYSAAEAIGSKLSMMYGSDTSEQTTQQVCNAIECERSIRCEMLKYTKANVPYWVELNLSPFYNDNGVCDYFVEYSYEVTRNKEERARALQEKQNLEFVLSASGIAFWDLDLKTNVMTRSINRDTFFGYKKRQKNWSYKKYLACIVEEDRSKVDATYTRALANAEDFEIEYRCEWPDKSIHWLWSKGGFLKDEYGQAIKAYGIESCIDEQKSAQAKLYNRAYADQLTQLPNRAAFTNSLKALVFRKAGGYEYSALLIIDIDNFRSVNDTLSHDVGDTILVEIAKRLTLCLPNVYSISKFGGDEFVLLFDFSNTNKNITRNEVEFIARTIQNIFVQPFYYLQQKLHITVSIGITIFNGNEINNVDLLQRAELALYHAKACGKNTHRYFDEKLQLDLIKRTSLENDLRQALVNRELFLVYQPKVEFDGSVVGAEALIRWKHPTRGIISPAEFIPVAEDSGLIVPIGEWVLNEAIAFIKRFPELNVSEHFILSINISSIQFNHLLFVEAFCAALKSSPLPTKQLMFEITEGNVIANIDESLVKINKLRTHGATFSLDDFGSGFSSLNYLKLLPIDEIKIDKSFIDDIVEDDRNIVILNAIIAIAQGLELKLVIEGVESLDQVTLLNELGAKVYQGFYFSKPLSETDLIRFIEARS